jgi:hypothetical protein
MNRALGLKPAIIRITPISYHFCPSFLLLDKKEDTSSKTISGNVKNCDQPCRLSSVRLGTADIYATLAHIFGGLKTVFHKGLRPQQDPVSSSKLTEWQRAKNGIDNIGASSLCHSYYKD